MQEMNRTIPGIIKQISAYSSAHEMIEEHDLLPKELQDNQDFCEFLQNFDDFECFGYFCVNDDTIICTDRINGDVISICSAAELIAGIKEQYDEFYA